MHGTRRRSRHAQIIRVTARREGAAHGRDEHRHPGGMGLEATVDLVRKILAATPATTDQERRRINAAARFARER